MIVVSGSSNNITYFSRYNRVDRWQLLDHNSRILSQGDTYLVAQSNGKIYHTGLTYTFISGSVFTYKAFFKDDNNTYHLANTTLLQSFVSDQRSLDMFLCFDKPKNIFKTLKMAIVNIINGGSASYVPNNILDGGSASYVSTNVVDGGSGVSTY